MRYRRPGDLVCYWRGGHFLLHRFTTGQLAEASPLAIDILSFFEEWRTAREFATAQPGRTHDWVQASLATLVASGFLLQDSL